MIWLLSVLLYLAIAFRFFRRYLWILEQRKNRIRPYYYRNRTHCNGEDWFEILFAAIPMALFWPITSTIRFCRNCEKIQAKRIFVKTPRCEVKRVKQEKRNQENLENRQRINKMEADAGLTLTIWED